MSTPAGYSGTPLWKKLGLKSGMRVQLLHADPGWSIPSDGSPAVERLDEADDRKAGLIVAFYRTAADYLADLDALGERIRPDGMLWIARPRRAAGHVSDLDEDVVRDAALDRGLVDVKVAALDADWSGMKLVWRLTNR